MPPPGFYWRRALLRLNLARRPRPGHHLAQALSPHGVPPLPGTSQTRVSEAEIYSGAPAPGRYSARLNLARERARLGQVAARQAARTKEYLATCKLLVALYERLFLELEASNIPEHRWCYPEEHPRSTRILIARTDALVFRARTLRKQRAFRFPPTFLWRDRTETWLRRGLPFCSQLLQAYY